MISLSPFVVALWFVSQALLLFLVGVLLKRCRRLDRRAARANSRANYYEAQYMALRVKTPYAYSREPNIPLY